MKASDIKKDPKYQKPLSSYERRWRKDILLKNPGASKTHVEHVIRLKRFD